MDKADEVARGIAEMFGASLCAEAMADLAGEIAAALRAYARGRVVELVSQRQEEYRAERAK